MTPSPTLSSLRRAIRSRASAARAAIQRRYFKTGPGEYGAGDLFVGLTVPDTRSLAREFRSLDEEATQALVRSPVHEERLLGLLLWVERYRTGTEPERAAIYRRYVRHFRYVNNWDLVDGTAPQIVGEYLADRDKGELLRWARSSSLWERRIAILATYAEIRRGRFDSTLRIARTLLKDPEDLIHKAVGWMLREVGKRSRGAEEAFLRRHHREMPRTMLRYAIEKFPERLRKAYLNGGV